MPKELVEKWAGRDPIARYAERLVVEHGFSEAEIDAMRAEVEATVDEGARRALEQPMPEPGHRARRRVRRQWEPLGDGNAPWSYWRETAPDDGNGRVP